MTTKYRLTSLSAENCGVDIHSKILCFFQLKTHRLSTLFHQKTKKQNQKKHGQRKENNRKKNCFFTSLGIASQRHVDQNAEEKKIPHF